MTSRPDSEYPYPPDPGQTHSADCWQWRGHHNCAVAEVDRLRAENALMRRVMDRLVAITDEHTPGLCATLAQAVAADLYVTYDDARAICELLGYDPVAGNRKGGER